MAIDPVIKEVILSMLARWKTTRLNRARLLELRDEIEKATEKRPPALKTIQSMVRRVVREAAQKKALRAVEITKTAAPIAAPVTEMAILQSISFDIAGMRRQLEQIAARLAEIERLLGLRAK